MKTIGIRALRENPGILSKSAIDGEFVLLTNHNKPISLSIPFSDDLVVTGLNTNLALKLYEDGVLSLSKAAKLANMSIEEFLLHLAELDIVVVNQSAAELDADLQILSE